MPKNTLNKQITQESIDLLINRHFFTKEKYSSEQIIEKSKNITLMNAIYVFFDKFYKLSLFIDPFYNKKLEQKTEAKVKILPKIFESSGILFFLIVFILMILNLI